MLLFQQVVTADSAYNVQNQANLTSFDVQNDTPYGVGISFSGDVGYQNADYHLMPHSILFGAKPIGVNARSIGGVKYNGTIYLYTRTPQGGGVINLTAVPACEITMIGYPTGMAPGGSTSLSRMSTIPNAVSSVGGTATSIINDANPAGTSVVESTQLGSPSSNIEIENDGTVVVGQFSGGVFTELLHIRPGNSTPLLIGNTDLLTQILGGLQILQNLHTNGALAVDGTSLLTGLVTASGGVSAAGFTLLSGVLTLLRGTLTQITGFSGTGPGTFTHGCSVTPNRVFVAYHGSFGTEPTVIPHEVSSGPATCVIQAQATYNWYAIAIVF